MTDIIDLDSFRSAKKTPVIPAKPVVLKKWKADMDARAIQHIQAVRADYRNGLAVSHACRSQAMRLGIDLLAATRDEDGMRNALSAIAAEFKVYSRDPNAIAMAEAVSDAVNAYDCNVVDIVEPECYVSVRLNTIYDDKVGDIVHYLYGAAEGNGERDEHHEIEMVGVPARRAPEVRDAILAMCGVTEEAEDFLTIDIRTFDPNTGVIGEPL